MIGKQYTPKELSTELLKNERFLRKGGVTFSGGEPLCHTDFIIETVSLLGGINTAVETCGYVDSETILRAAKIIDEFYFDIKLIDDNEHIKYTGRSNALILKNASLLLEGGKFLTVRIPLIPGVTDTDENLSGIASFLEPYRNKVKVELIPYNVMTGAKYASVGRKYAPPFNERGHLNKNLTPFMERNITATAY